MTKFAPYAAAVLEAYKHDSIRNTKTLIDEIKGWTKELEDTIFSRKAIPEDIILLNLHRLDSLMTRGNSKKLEFLLFNPPTSKIDIYEISIYTHEGESSITLLFQLEKDFNIFFVSEAGNISTLQRIAYRLIRLMFIVKHRSIEKVCRQIEHKRAKSDNLSNCLIE